jgi:hypothetical protein
MEQLRLHLDGAAGAIDARAVRDAIADLLKLTCSLDDEEDEPVAPTWVVSELSIGSARCGVRPAPGEQELGSRQILTVLAGARELARTVGIPRGWTEETVETLANLAQLRHYYGVDEAYLLGDDPADRILLGDEVLHNSRTSLRGSARSLATIRGNIVRYVSDGSRHEISVREGVDHRPVRVTFPPGLDDAVLAALTRKESVVVTGMLKRNSKGQKLSLRAETLRGLPTEPRARASTQDMVGALGADWTGGLSSTEWVRGQRNA